MDRRAFLAASAASAVGALGSANSPRAGGAETPGFASPKEAMKGPREELLFVTCTYANTGIDKPDYLAVVDAKPGSKTYGQVVHRLKMPKVGDELHHFGWNICSSCHGKPGDRRYLIVPGLKSGRIHIVDAKDPLALKVHKVIEPEEIAKKADLSAPHTAHCLPTGEIMLSMLGNAKGEAPGGFLLLDDKYEIKGRWEKDLTGMNFNYDFWYQPQHNAMVSSEWAAPKTFAPGPNFDDVKAGKYGQKIHLWDWKERKIKQSFDLGAASIPLEVRFLHDPSRPIGFVGAALSSTMWRFAPDGRGGQKWAADKVIELAPVKNDKFPGGAVPGLISDFVISMDDRFLYLAAWLHGEVKQYDITDPGKPRLTGTVKLGGALGKPEKLMGKELAGGPQMLQLSLDGKRLYATNSLYSTWDNAFYPDLGKQGSWMVQIDCDTEKGGLALNDKFCVDFGKEPDGPSRAHEVRYPGGDCTSDIFS
ncbi:selenium-binding family protein [Gemmata sp. G18]|uniref:Selenium-binding family protein n=1 Tax=Gemmata palustris TaxID=2822762 RepID=A0ABS5C182_9BACT|nr:selenium-binding family protein [Gemmata palustris]MBP3959412.1 selenium-binding family protein [Gemmata palustris]